MDNNTFKALDSITIALKEGGGIIGKARGILNLIIHIFVPRTHVNWQIIIIFFS